MEVDEFILQKLANIWIEPEELVKQEVERYRFVGDIWTG